MRVVLLDKVNARPHERQTLNVVFVAHGVMEAQAGALVVHDESKIFEPELFNKALRKTDSTMRAALSASPLLCVTAGLRPILFLHSESAVAF